MIELDEIETWFFYPKGVFMLYFVRDKERRTNDVTQSGNWSITV